MKTVGEILEKNDSTFAKLIKKTQTNKDLSAVLQSMLDTDFAKHCHFANLKGSALTITVTNTAWATKLRYAIPDIIKDIRTQPEFKTVKTIRYKIIPTEYEAKPQKKAVRLSRDNEILWQETLANLKKN